MQAREFSRRNPAYILPFGFTVSSTGDIRITEACRCERSLPPRARSCFAGGATFRSRHWRSCCTKRATLLSNPIRYGKRYASPSPFGKFPFGESEPGHRAAAAQAFSSRAKCSERSSPRSSASARNVAESPPAGPVQPKWRTSAPPSSGMGVGKTDMSRTRSTIERLSSYVKACEGGVELLYGLRRLVRRPNPRSCPNTRTCRDAHGACSVTDWAG